MFLFLLIFIIPILFFGFACIYADLKEYGFDVRLALQHYDIIRKDAKYIAYLRDVIVPRRLEQERLKKEKEAVEYIRKEILEDIQNGRQVSVFLIGGGLDKYHSDKEIKKELAIKIADELGFKVSEVYNYHIHFEPK